jgi:hypothetical protein
VNRNDNQESLEGRSESEGQKPEEQKPLSQRETKRKRIRRGIGKKGSGREEALKLERGNAGEKWSGVDQLKWKDGSREEGRKSKSREGEEHLRTAALFTLAICFSGGQTGRMLQSRGRI